MNIFKGFNERLDRGVFVDIDQIKELIKTLEESGLDKLTLKDKDGSEIHLEKTAQPSPRVVTEHAAPAVVHQVAPLQSAPQQPQQAEASVGESITSPLVGTFYSAPSPEDPPFVKVGDMVKEDSVVCIVEAMKVMNEVKAGKSGKVTQICVSDADPVEFGTKLFTVE